MTPKSIPNILSSFSSPIPPQLQFELLTSPGCGPVHWNTWALPGTTPWKKPSPAPPLGLGACKFFFHSVIECCLVALAQATTATESSWQRGPGMSWKHRFTWAFPNLWWFDTLTTLSRGCRCNALEIHSLQNHEPKTSVLYESSPSLG